MVSYSIGDLKRAIYRSRSIKSKAASDVKYTCMLPDIDRFIKHSRVSVVVAA